MGRKYINVTHSINASEKADSIKEKIFKVSNRLMKNKNIDNNHDDTDSKEQGKSYKINKELQDAIDTYNQEYMIFNENGISLFRQRERAVDVIKFVQDLVNSIANHPKTFDTDIIEIEENKKHFTQMCVYAEEELKAAKISAKSAGPIGWGVAGVSLLASVVLLKRKKMHLTTEKLEEIENIKKNTFSLFEAVTKIENLCKETNTLREGLNEQLKMCMKYYNCNYSDISDEEKIQLGTIVNNTKSLSTLLKINIQ